MNRKLLTDNHIKFISLNPWLKDIDFNNVDIIQCKSDNLYHFILSLIENKVFQCNILINEHKDRWYYNGNHYFNKVRFVSFNNEIRDILRDSEGNILFWCEDKGNWWDDNKGGFKYNNNFNIDIKVNKGDLILIYNE